MNISNIHTGALRALAAASIAALMVLVAGGMWMYGTIAHAATEPVISAVSVSPTNTGATVTWTTDEAANSQVAYGTSLPYSATTTLDSSDVTNHSETLSGLTPNTTYHYEVISEDNSSNTDMSADNTFMTTNAASTTATSSAVVTLSTYSGGPGSSITVNGSGFSASEAVNILLNGSTTSTTANGSGDFSTTLTAPSTTGTYTISATGVTSGDVASNAFTVNAVATSEPVISSIVANPTDTGATITWTTDQPASSQVDYGLTSSYGNMTALDSMQETSQTATITGLTPGITYHFDVLSTSASGSTTSSDQIFTTTNTGSSTDLTTLQNEIAQLQSEVSTLQSQVASLMGTSGSGSTTPPAVGPATIDQNGQSIGAGGTIDFGGHNFGHEENVTVMMDGKLITTAHADGGGNFSTGSLTVPSTAGSYTYLFVGQNSGKAANATITVQ